MTKPRTITIGDVDYPVELNNSLPTATWYLRKGKPMPVKLNEEKLKKAAAQMSAVTKRIQERMIKDALFGERPPYSPFVSTATMAPNIARKPLSFRPIAPLFDVITSPYVVETKKLSREKKRGFWGRLWDGLTDLNPWPYSRIEYYELEVPAIMIDRVNNRIICYPSLEREVKKAVRGGAVR